MHIIMGNAYHNGNKGLAVDFIYNQLCNCDHIRLSGSFTIYVV